MILVVGDVMTDVVVHPTGPLVIGSDRRARIASHPGGSGANVACWIAHLGGQASFAGRTGVADNARQCEILRSHRVTPHLAADPDTPTGIVVAVISSNGERSFYTDRGANGAALLHVSGHTLFASPPRAAALDLVAAARARGVPVSVDAGSSAFLAEVGAPAFVTWTSGADFCFANAGEAAILGVGGTYGCRIVTHGASGAEAWQGDVHVAVETPEIVAVDTTGAGDALIAGFLRAWVRKASLRACLIAGTQAGAGAAARSGARPPHAA